MNIYPTKLQEFPAWRRRMVTFQRKFSFGFGRSDTPYEQASAKTNNRETRHAPWAVSLAQTLCPRLIFISTNETCGGLHDESFSVCCGQASLPDTGRNLLEGVQESVHAVVEVMEAYQVKSIMYADRKFGDS